MVTGAAPADATIPRMTAAEHHYLGLELLDAQKYDEAIAQFQLAIGADAQFIDALHGLAQAYYAKEDFANSIATAKRILEIAPEDILAWTCLSLAYRKKGMTAEAVDASAHAREISPLKVQP